MTSSLKNVCGIMWVALLALPAGAQGAHPSTVNKLSIVSEAPFQLRIQTNAAVAPQIQMVTGPERLVIDIPGATPGPALRGIVVKHGDVRGVRASLFSTRPPVTRIVVDLNTPQWYRVAPDSSGLVVTMGSDSESAGNAPATVGWVAARTPVHSVANRPVAPVVVSRKYSQLERTALKGVTVQFTNGLLTIHAHNATLSEVLYQVQKQTGAEIAIPSGTESQRVAADFGPGTPGAVLGELLNGSGLNFVVVGSEADPNVLRSVILSSQGGSPAPANFATGNADPTAENIEPENVIPGAPGGEVAPIPDAPPNGNPMPDSPVSSSPPEPAPQ